MSPTSSRRPGPLAERSLKSILVFCRPILGDMILAGPVFRNLREWQPQARITAVCAEGMQDFLSFVPEVDETVQMPRRHTPGSLQSAGRWLRLIRELRRQHFDLVYDIMQTDRSSLVCAAIRSTRRTGFVKGPRRLRHRVYTDTAPWTDGDPYPDHALDLYLRPLEVVGMPIRTRSIEIAPTHEDVSAARALVLPLSARGEAPLVICHPGASSVNKCWPIEEFAAICDEMQSDLGARVLLLGGPAEVESLRVLRSLMATEPVVIERTLPLGQLAAVLAEADLFFGHDSGPMHVAAAVGTPTVALFGASSPAQWKPLGDGHSIVRPSMPCAPCSYPSLCEPPNPYKMFCVRRIARNEVRGAVRRQLLRLRKNGRPNLPV